MKRRRLYIVILLCLVADTSASVDAHHHHAKASRVRHFLASSSSAAVVSNASHHHVTHPSAVASHSTVQTDEKAGDVAKGRMGHSAFYLPTTNELLFVGGQVGHDGMFITNDISTLNLSLPYPSHLNPQSTAPTSTDLLPTAWAASAVGSAEDLWIIGGVAQNCEHDAPAVRRGGIGNLWAAVMPAANAPARRRQMRAVSTMNSTSWTADLWVWGGLAEEYTCSSESVGYMAIDVWHTLDSTVETIRWSSAASKAVPKGFMPPITDYAAISIKDKNLIAFIGGQSASGSLAEMDRILVFDTVKREWSVKDVQKPATGRGPSPRHGHVAVLASCTQIIVHGGINKDEKAAGNSWVLDISTADWRWSHLVESDHSWPAPKLAYHTATAVTNQSIVFAFGMHLHSQRVTNAVWFLTQDSSNAWSWSPTFGHQAEIVQTQPHPQPQTAVVHDTLVQPSPSSVATSAAVTSASSAAQPQGLSAHASKVLASTISGVFASALAVGVIVMLLKRRASTVALARSVADRKQSTEADDGSAPVSQLLFTRPVTQRTLALDSPPACDLPSPNMLADAAVSSDMSRSPGSQASVTSYPYLTALPMMFTESNDQLHSPTLSTSSMAYSTRALVGSEEPSPQPGWLAVFRQSFSPKLGYMEEGSPKRSRSAMVKPGSRPAGSKPRRTVSSTSSRGLASSLSPRYAATSRLGHAPRTSDTDFVNQAL